MRMPALMRPNSETGKSLKANEYRFSPSTLSAVGQFVLWRKTHNTVQTDALRNHGLLISTDYDGRISFIYQSNNITTVWKLLFSSAHQLKKVFVFFPRGFVMQYTHQEFVHLFLVTVFRLCIKLLLGVLVIKERTLISNDIYILSINMLCPCSAIYIPYLFVIYSSDKCSNSNLVNSCVIFLNVSWQVII